MVSQPRHVASQRLAAWFFAEVPAARLSIVRLLVFGFGTVYLLAQAAPLLRVTRFDVGAFRPVGIVQVLDQPLSTPVATLLWGLAVGCGILATTGVLYRYSAPAFALLLLWVTSYRSSWGMIFHTENLLVLHTMLLAVVPAAGDTLHWSMSRRRWVHDDALGNASSYGWPLRVLSLTTVATYVVAGIAKLQHSGLAWAGGHEIRTHIAYDAVRKLELGSLWSPLGAWLVQFEGLFLPLAVLTLALEFGAPLALMGGRFAWVWCLTAWSFHLGVLLLMLIVFPYPLLGIAYLSFFAVERPLSALLERLSRHHQTSLSSAEDHAPPTT